MGDNARAPYGGKSEGEIRALAEEAFAKLSEYPLKAAVIACNTVTAEAAAQLRAEYPFPVVGVEPAIRPAVLSGARRVLVLATGATLSSPRFRRLCSQFSEAEILPFAPESLARDIEENIFRLEEVELSRHLPRVACDAVVLGCTHYIYLKKRIEEFYGCPAFDGNAGAAKRLSSLLQNEGFSPRFAQFVGTADHQVQKTNICSKKFQKKPKNAAIFIEKAKNKNKKVFLTFFNTNKCS